jgi:Spy/CpxP family protein refolding chaperone
MMNHWKWLAVHGLLVTGLLISILPAVNPAIGIGPGLLQRLDGGGRGLVYTHLFSKLNLSEVQQQAFDRVQAETRAKIKPMVQEFRPKVQAFITYASGPNADRAETRARLRELQGMRNEMMETALDGWFEWKEELTEEQLEQLVALEEEKFAALNTLFGNDTP